MGEENPGSGDATDEQSIRALLARLFEAWAKGDGKAYAGCFTEDGHYITFNGIHLRGRGENAEFHQALFQTVLRGTELSAEIEDIEFPAPGIAVMHTAGRGKKRSCQTYVLAKIGGEWLIHSFQNTKVNSLSVWMTRLIQARAAKKASSAEP